MKNRLEKFLLFRTDLVRLCLLSLLVGGSIATARAQTTNMSIPVSGGGTLTYTSTTSVTSSCPSSYPVGPGVGSQPVTSTALTSFAYNGLGIGNGPTYVTESNPNYACPQGWQPSTSPFPMSVQSNGATYYILFTPPAAPNVTAPGTASLDSLSLSVNSNPATWGSTVQINATESFPNLSGTVTYKDGATVIGTATMSQSSAAFSTSFSVGSHSLTASFTSQSGTIVAPALTLTVNRATPTVSWSAPGTITYGTALSGAQLNASASVPGSFSYSPAAGAVLPAGTQTLNVTFTPTDTTDYNTVSSNVSLTVSRATPSISWSAPAAITYGTALSASQLNASGSVPGSFSYTPAAGAVLSAGAQTLTATFTPSDTGNYNSVSSTVSLTVNKATPTISWSSPAAITYGTALSGAQLNASGSVPGSLYYSPGAGAVLSAGTQSLTVNLVPSDTGDYNNASTSVSLTVNRATPTISWGTPAAITYGTALSAAQLNASGSVAGSFSYSPALGAVLSAGAQNLTANFTPTDTANYNSTSASVSLTVNKATPTISWSAPAAITYGTALSSTQLNASGSVPGTISYSPPAGTVLSAGSQSLVATFTPTDTGNYNSASSTVLLTVNKATPTISWPAPAAITYGTALSATQLNATGSVPGTLSYSPATGAVLQAGARTLTVTLAPTDTTNYNSAGASVSLTVNQATPTISWATPAAITYGTALSSTQLNATASVPGTISYSPASGTVLQAGTPTLTATLTPTDSVDYKSVSASVSLTVNKATPTISWPVPAAINYGSALSSTQLNATGSVPGTISYSPASGTVLQAGTRTLTATLTPTDVTDYANASGSVSLVVNKVTPTITWATPAGITYGTALSATQLNATASVPGSFSYSPASGTVLTAGTKTITATFAPTDTTDYNNASAQVSIVVSQATPTISAWPTASAITYGQSLASSTLSGGTASVAGTFSWTTSSTAPGAGTAAQSVKFTPTDTVDYQSVSGSVNVTVNKATPTVSAWATAGAIIYGQTLASSTLTGGTASVPGSFSWTSPTFAPPTGTTSQAQKFTPTDATDYNVVNGSTNVTVNKATPVITWGAPATVPNGTFLGSIQLNASASVPGTFAYSPPSGTPLTPGLRTLTASFTPTDTTNYFNVNSSVPLRVTIAPSQGLIATVAGNNINGFLGDGGAATSGEIQGASGVAADTHGNLYIADSSNGVIRKVAADTGVISTFAGTTCGSTSSNGQCGYAGDGFAATSAKLSSPAGVATDASGNLYIADQDNCVIRQVDVNGTITTIAGTGACGFGGDNGPAKSALLRYPRGLTLDSAGNIYIADTFNNVIRKINASSKYITTVAGVAGSSGSGADGIAATSAGLNLPGGIAVDASGNLYIADSHNSVIRKVTASSGLINTIAGKAGNFGYAGDGGPAVNAVLDYPDSIAIDSAGNLYIGDRDNNVVRKISTYGIITAVGIGSADYSGDGGLANSAELNWPEGVGLDAQGNLYIADDGNAVIRAVGAGKLTPSINWPSPAPITYGTKLDGTQLNASTSVAGTWTYTPAAGAVVAVGQQVLSAVFTPTDNADYASTSFSVPITVNKGTPSIVWPSPAAIASTTALSSTQLNATATLNGSSVAGTFVYSPASGVKLSAGTQVLSVQFTPTDTTDFNPISGVTSIKVNSGSIFDQGTVALYVDSGSGLTQVARTTYASGATPSTVAQGLAAGVLAGSPVTVSAINDQLTVVSTGSGPTTNYAYSLQTASWDSTDFSQPSFATPAITGSLLGGFPSTAPQSPTTLYSFSVPDAGGYDYAGNLASFSDSVMGTRIFSYDTLNRLSGGSVTTAPASGPGVNLLPNYCWSYDAFGNRRQQMSATSAFTSGGGPTTCTQPPTGQIALLDNTIGANNQISSSNARGVGTIYYDASGDMVTDGSNQYLYDAEGRICAVASSLAGQTIMTGYMYDAEGTRVSKGAIQVWSCNPTTAQYVTKADYILGPGGEQMSEYRMQPGGAMAWEHTNVWAAGRLLATYEQNSRVVNGTNMPDSLLHFYLDDPLGTRRAQVDYAGNPEKTCASLPYGDGESCGTTPTEHLFTGKERDSESGNDYFGARYYASSMGRWMSPDRPGYQVKEDPQSLNLYSYVRNRPLIATDPTGNFDCKGNASECFDAKLAAIREREASFDVNNINLFSLQKVSDVVGNYGDHNGVVVNFADLGGSANDHVGAQTKDKTITFNTSFSMSIDTMAATLIHEGTHVLQNEIADSFKKSPAGGLVNPAGLLQTTKPSWTGLVHDERQAYEMQGQAEHAMHMKGQIYDPADVRPGADKRRDHRIDTFARASANKSCGSGSLEAEGSKCSE